jgi:hypothetical protein
MLALREPCYRQRPGGAALPAPPGSDRQLGATRQGSGGPAAFPREPAALEALLEMRADSIRPMPSASIGSRV